MTISELETYTPEDVQALNALMHELSASSFCNEDKLKAVVNDPNAHIYVIRDEGNIIGSACLCVAHTTEQTLGFVESVVVSEKYRGQHLGRKLMEHLLREAKSMGVDCLHLTSKPKRVAANRLYQSQGFKQHETNVYKLNIK